MLRYMAKMVLETGIVLLLVFGRLTCAEPARVSSSAVCPIESVSDSIFWFRGSECPLNGAESIGVAGVIEGDEVSLQRVLNMVHKNSHDILSKYGVHGFPTLFLINSTMRVRYHGSRTLGSLVTFYSDVTGIKTAPLDRTSFETIGHPSSQEKHNFSEQESCPFSWARSPENLLQEETYLALATAFVLLRLLYFVFPALRVGVQFAWRRHVRNMSLRSLWDHPQAYLNRAIQLFKSLKEPCKRSNLQEGAMNCKAWASKSLASVSIGDASTSRSALVSDRH